MNNTTPTSISKFNSIYKSKKEYIIHFFLGAIFFLFSHSFAYDNPSYFLLSSSIIPGSGQIICGHPVKGTSLFLFEGILGGLAYNENKIINSFYSRQYKSISDSITFYKQKVDSVNNITQNQVNDTTTNYYNEVDFWVYKKLFSKGNLTNSNQLTNMYLIWTGGLYVYNLFDATEILIKKHFPNNNKKNPTTALWLSAVIPGLGQIYNGSYSKAGMVIMSQSALVASAIYRHQIYNYYENKLNSNDIFYNDSLYKEKTISSLKRHRNHYRRCRNSFIWYSIGFYFYNIFDALVDAHLHDFNNNKLTISPNIISPGVTLSLKF